MAPARDELRRAQVWDELLHRGAVVATVPFSGRAGRGGQTGRIALLDIEGAVLVERERWSSRDELCFALEAPVWERFGCFAGHPLISGELIWLLEERVVEISATRGGNRFEEWLR